MLRSSRGKNDCCAMYLLRNIRSPRQQMFCKRGVLKKIAKFTEKYLRRSLIFNKVADLRSVTSLKKRL